MAFRAFRPSDAAVALEAPNCRSLLSLLCVQRVHPKIQVPQVTEVTSASCWMRILFLRNSYYTANQQCICQIDMKLIKNRSSVATVHVPLSTTLLFAPLLSLTCRAAHYTFLCSYNVLFWHFGLAASPIMGVCRTSGTNDTQSKTPCTIFSQNRPYAKIKGKFEVSR